MAGWFQTQTQLPSFSRGFHLITGEVEAAMAFDLAGIEQGRPRAAQDQAIDLVRLPEEQVRLGEPFCDRQSEAATGGLGRIQRSERLP